LITRRGFVSQVNVVAVTLPIPALAHGDFLHIFIRDDPEPDNEGSTWFSPSSTTERKVRWVGQHSWLLLICVKPSWLEETGE
jgi:hypothetical protein